MERNSRRAFLSVLRSGGGTSVALAALSSSSASAKPPAQDTTMSAGLGTFNVRTFGAQGNGSKLDTIAIQSAIDACARAGGGLVVFPNGTYLSGMVELKDNVTLHFAPLAILLGSTNIKDYPARPTGVNDIDALPYTKDTWALIYAFRAKNIALDGTGVIDGQSKAFEDGKRIIRFTPRPRLVYFQECSGVTVRDLTLKDAGKWTAHFALCDHLKVQGIKLSSYGAWNNDGIDIDSCREVVISDCIIASSDDAICLKSSFPQPCKNVVVTNCTISSGANALKLGTHSLGGFENIAVSNCSVQNAYYGGIKIEAVDGGHLKNLTFSNINMDNVGTPVFVKLGNRGFDFGVPGIEQPRRIATLQDVLISNICARVTQYVSKAGTRRAGSLDPHSKILRLFHHRSSRTFGREHSPGQRPYCLRPWRDSRRCPSG